MGTLMSENVRRNFYEKMAAYMYNYINRKKFEFYLYASLIICG